MIPTEEKKESFENDDVIAAVLAFRLLNKNPKEKAT